MKRELRWAYYSDKMGHVQDSMAIDRAFSFRFFCSSYSWAGFPSLSLALLSKPHFLSGTKSLSQILLTIQEKQIESPLLIPNPSNPWLFSVNAEAL